MSSTWVRYALMSAFPLWLSVAVILFWKFEPRTRISTVEFELAANAGVMLVITIPPAGMVVIAGVTEARIINRLVEMPYWPSGLVTTTSHEPESTEDGSEKVQVIREEDHTLTLVAVIFR